LSRPEENRANWFQLPWRPQIYEGRVLKETITYIATRDIVVIHGAMQTGKTTLLKLLMKDLPPKILPILTWRNTNLLLYLYSLLCFGIV
jgi:predicted AAA+ superfamily ATPase